MNNKNNPMQTSLTHPSTFAALGFASRLAVSTVIAALAVSAVIAGDSSLARAAAPVGRYTIAAEVVTDTSTGLQWQRSIDANAFTHANALAYCLALTLDGQDDWRVPSLHELLSLGDPTEFSPAIDAAAFPATPSSSFWTATPIVGGTDQMWAVHFREGGSYQAPVSILNRVRCVR